MSSSLDALARWAGHASYAAYLRSEHWKTFSEWVRQKRCYCCGSGDKLQVHHLTYKTLGKELPDDVATVCDRCHVAIHEMVKDGEKLDKAHVTLRGKQPHQPRQERKRRQHRAAKQWVSLPSLVNRSKHQTLDELTTFLAVKGLLSDGQPTEKARRCGLSRVTEKGPQWCRKRYVQLMQADAKVQKFREWGREVHPSMLRRALV